MMRLARIGLTSVPLLGLAMPALALDRAEAEAVVGIVETIAADMGEGMVAGAGGIFYDYDALGAAQIPAAGFDRSEWVDAYEAVVRGYMATIPQAEFDAMFEAPRAQLEGSQLPEEQKAALRDHVEGLIAEAQQARQDGMAHVETVRPLADRLYPLFFGE